MKAKILLAGLVALLGSAWLAHAQPVIMLSADTEGRLFPCRTCPAAQALGGMARRATVVIEARKIATDLLLVDAGNALFGGDGIDEQGKPVLQAYEALKYDAVNLSYRDFRFGPEVTLALINGAKVPFLSANILRGEKLVGVPYLVKQSGGRKVAIIGLSQPPAGLTDLPHLQRQFAGLTFRPAIDALAEVLPKAKAEADDVVLLYYGPLSALRPLRQKFGAQLAAILIGGVSPDDLPEIESPRFAAAEEQGKGLTKLTLKSPAVVDEIRLDPAVAEEPAMATLVSPYQPANPTSTQPSAVGVPRVLEPGKIVAIRNSVANRGVQLTVINASLVPTYGTLAAPPGRQLLVLATEWENVIPLTLVRQQKVPTTYKIPNLADHLYLLIGRSQVARLAVADNAAGLVPVRDFQLDQLGDRIIGNVVFDVPAGPINAQLRFYDYAHGHMDMVLTENASPDAEAKPLAPARQNEVVDAAVFSVTRPEQLDRQPAPAGMQQVMLDFRARSRFMLEADATAFDPKARPGQKMKIGTVADWTDSRKYLQLVVDGERGYGPQPQTTLVDQPRFLPDLMTGGTVVFLAPADAKSLELRCDFPNAKTPGGQVIRPQGITLPLEGTRPKPAVLKPIAKTEDSVFVVSVTKQATPDAFAGQKPADGKRWIVLDVTVSTKSKDGENFQTAEQLKIVNAGGEQASPDDATYAGVYRPGELVWIPAGERRTFQVAYQFPDNELQPRLAYRGVDKADVINLVRLAPSGAPPEVATKPPEPGKVDEPAKTNEAPKVDEPAKVVAPARVQAPAPQAVETIDVKGEKFPARVPVKPNLQAKGIAGVGITPEQVNASIDLAATYLWNVIDDDRTKKHYALGVRREHTIMSLALVHSNYHKKNAEFDAALRKWLGKFEPNEVANTYEVGITAMIIEAYGDPTYLPQLRACTKFLVESQGADGSWGYGRQVDRKFFATAAEDKRVLKIEGGKPVDQIEQVTRELPYSDQFQGDSSVTQYALLGLNAAERSGIKVPADVWNRALKVHQERQVPEDGGWGYHGPSSPYGSMTAAGICGIALTRHALQQPNDDGTVERGLGWLNAHFSVSEHPGSREWLYYYLYSLERVGRILDTEFIGEHEWYPLGVQFLLTKQKPDGSWEDPIRTNEDDVMSSFALLFLTRATPSLIAEKRDGPGTLKTAVLIPPGKKLYIILDASGSMLEEMNGKVKFEIAREALTQLIKELPNNAEVGLRAYGYRKRAIEEGASEDTKLLVPVAKLEREKLLLIMQGIRARGKTPMALSLEQAKAELPQATEDSPVTVLLLTDGGEDTLPRKDPVAAAKAFADLPNVRLRIVGFDINRPEWSEQLQAMAAAANGQYLPASQGDALLRELRAAVYETPDAFTVLDEAGKSVGGGKFGESMQFPAGKYRIRATYAGKMFEQDMWMNAGGTTSVTFQAANVGKTDEGKPVEPSTAKPAEAPAAKPRFCTSCGAKLEGTPKFCPTCGAKIAP